jgi:hypothetical protein
VVFGSGRHEGSARDAGMKLRNSSLHTVSTPKTALYIDVLLSQEGLVGMELVLYREGIDAKASLNPLLRLCLNLTQNTGNAVPQDTTYGLGYLLR